MLLVRGVILATGFHSETCNKRVKVYIIDVWGYGPLSLYLSRLVTAVVHCSTYSSSHLPSSPPLPFPPLPSSPPLPSPPLPSPPLPSPPLPSLPSPPLPSPPLPSPPLPSPPLPSPPLPSPPLPSPPLPSPPLPSPPLTSHLSPATFHKQPSDSPCRNGVEH